MGAVWYNREKGGGEMGRLVRILPALLAFLLLVGCGTQQQGQRQDQQEQQGQSGEATLFIGMEGDFAEYPLAYSGELTPEKLIAGIAELTGWNLDLAGEVTAGGGGVTVCFAEESSLFVGPPEPQREEFFVYSAEQLDVMILDSVQRTLQENSPGTPLSNPETPEVYFCGPDGGALTLPQLGLVLPQGEPYRGILTGDTHVEGVFEGLDGETAAVRVNGEQRRYPVADSEALWTLRALEPGFAVSFEIERDKEGTERIVRVYGD